jgi:hypothetical protein
MGTGCFLCGGDELVLYMLFVLTSVFEGLYVVSELLCFSVDFVVAGFVPIAIALWGVFFFHGSWF